MLDKILRNARQQDESRIGLSPEGHVSRPTANPRDAIIEETWNNNYTPETLTTLTATSGYFRNAALGKLALIEKYGRDREVLDVGCAGGDYLIKLSGHIKRGVGLDFQKEALAVANKRRADLNLKHLEFIYGNARRIPFGDGSFDLAYSFCCLYSIPEVHEVINEVARVLRPRGIAILEFGNLYSLNTLVARAHSELSRPYHLRIGKIRATLTSSGLGILEWQRHQILPLWGAKPWYLRPVLSLRWSKLLARQIRGRMLDEILCRLPVLRCFSFRQLIVCQKMAM